MQPVDLAALEALLAKATPGEWAVAEPWAGYCSINADYTPILYTTSAGCENAEANHDSIAALHNAAPALIARIRELEALTEWRPIETAPKDGTKVDLWTSEGRRCDCRFRGDRWEEIGWCGFDSMGWTALDWPPTHWRSLIAGPEVPNA